MPTKDKEIEIILGPKDEEFDDDCYLLIPITIEYEYEPAYRGGRYEPSNDECLEVTDISTKYFGFESIIARLNAPDVYKYYEKHLLKEMKLEAKDVY